MSLELSTIQKEILSQQEMFLQLLQQERDFLSRHSLKDKQASLASVQHAATRLLEIPSNAKIQFTTEEADKIVLEVGGIHSEVNDLGMSFRQGFLFASNVFMFVFIVSTRRGRHYRCSIEKVCGSSSAREDARGK